MSDGVPSTLRIAVTELTHAFVAAGWKDFHPLTAPWPRIEEQARKLLGGAFRPDVPEHRTLQLRLGALFGARLVEQSGAFWFRQRDAIGGFSIGFPNTVFTVSPFAVVALALAANRVDALEEAAAKLQSDYAQTLKREGAATKPLTHEDYERYFDPSFVEFLALDERRAHEVWAMTPQRLIAELKDAQLRAAGLSRETTAWLERDVLGGLRALDGGTPLIEQASRDLRTVERVGELFAARYGTGLTTEAGWLDVGLRLLCLDPTADPEISPGALNAVKQGAGPVKAFLHEMPPRAEAPGEGILGLFSPAHLSAPHPALAKEHGLRLIRANPRPLLPLLQQFDRGEVDASAARYGKRLSTATGRSLTPSAQEAALLDEGLGFVERFQKTLALAVRDQLDLCIRRAPESEGRTGGGKAALRAALQG